MKHRTPTFTYEVKKYAELRTSDGIAYTFTLWIDGKAVATVENRGDGGALWVSWRLGGATGMWDTNCPAATKVLAHIATLSPITFPDCDPLPYDMELWLGEIAEEFVNDRRFGRLCKTKTVFRVEGDEEGRWQVISRPYSPEFAAQLRAREKVAEFWNERV